MLIHNRGTKLNHMKANLDQKKVKQKTNWYRRERALKMLNVIEVDIKPSCFVNFELLQNVS